MEKTRMEKTREEIKQEFMNRIGKTYEKSPDVQTMLDELLERTALLDKGELPANFSRIDQMKFTYVMAQKYASGPNVKVTMSEDTPFPGMGSVQIEGKFITFTNTEFFARMAEFSDNTDMYHLLDGTVRIVFTFHGLSHGCR